MRTLRRILPAILLILVVGNGTKLTVGQGNGINPPPPRECDGQTSIHDVELIDDFTFRITLCAPDASLPAKLARPTFSIYPAEYLTNQFPPVPPIGTGPYILETWDPGSDLVMQRFDGYWGEPARTEELVFRWNAEAAARLSELQAGTVDGIDFPAPEDYERIRESEGLALYDRAATNIGYIGLNNRFEPLGDVRVRRAIAMSIDRQSIVNVFYPAGSILATQFIPPSAFGYTPEVTWYDFNPEQGRALLAEAGYPDGFEINLYYRDVVRSYLLSPERVAETIQGQLAENLNVRVNLVELESGYFLDAVDAGELSMYLLGWSADYLDATAFLDHHFGPFASDQFGEKYPELVDIVGHAGQTPDLGARYDSYVQANLLIRDLVPVIPLAQVGSAVAFRTAIEGAYAHPLSLESFAAMENPSDNTIVWLQSYEPSELYCGSEIAWNVETWRVCAQIMETLVTVDSHGNIGPGLATSWTANEDATVWTFTLREGVRFHDGSALDAIDCVCSLVDAGFMLTVANNIVPSSPKQAYAKGDFSALARCSWAS